MDTTLATEDTTQKILLVSDAFLFQAAYVNQVNCQHTLIRELPCAIHAEYGMVSLAQRHACTEGTREEILAKLMTWATQVTSTKVYWLTRMAGTGKTTIAYTFSEILDKNQMLGATFFCSHQEHETSNTDLIFSTLAYQLAQHFPLVSQALVNILQKDPRAGFRIMHRQFTDLIMEPAKAAFSHSGAKSVVIVIDALDECINQRAVADMLSIISQYAAGLPLKFFITSRPEQQIRKKFNQSKFEPHSRFVLHEVEEDVVDADIEIYLRSRFKEIADESDKEVSADAWPSNEQLAILVHLADKLFIYAATVCEYVAGGGSIEKHLEVATKASTNTLNGKTETLDNLYSHILDAAYKAADTHEKLHIKKVLQVVIYASNPLSVGAICILLSSTSKDVLDSKGVTHIATTPDAEGSAQDPNNPSTYTG